MSSETYAKERKQWKMKLAVLFLLFVSIAIAVPVLKKRDTLPSVKRMKVDTELKTRTKRNAAPLVADSDVCFQSSVEETPEDLLEMIPAEFWDALEEAHQFPLDAWKLGEEVLKGGPDGQGEDLDEDALSELEMDSQNVEQFKEIFYAVMENEGARRVVANLYDCYMPDRLKDKISAENDADDEKEAEEFPGEPLIIQGDASNIQESAALPAIVKEARKK